MPKILDPETHTAVERDGVPRQAQYDDGVDRMLYKDGQVVRSAELVDWPAEQEALAARDAERAKHQAMRESLGNAARTHAGKDARQLTFPEMRDLFALFLEREGLLDAEGRVQAPPQRTKE